LKVLIRFKQQLGAPGHLCRPFRVQLELGGQGAGHQRGQEHDQKGDRVAVVIGVQGKAGNSKEEVKGQNTGNGRDQAANRASGGHRYQHDAQDIKGDDIGLCKAPAVK
jgi:hypothetical protein